MISPISRTIRGGVIFQLVQRSSQDADSCVLVYMLMDKTDCATAKEVSLQMRDARATYEIKYRIVRSVW